MVSARGCVEVIVETVPDASGWLLQVAPTVSNLVRAPISVMSVISASRLQPGRNQVPDSPANRVTVRSLFPAESRSSLPLPGRPQRTVNTRVCNTLKNNFLKNDAAKCDFAICDFAICDFAKNDTVKNGRVSASPPSILSPAPAAVPSWVWNTCRQEPRGCQRHLPAAISPAAVSPTAISRTAISRTSISRTRQSPLAVVNLEPGSRTSRSTMMFRAMLFPAKPRSVSPAVGVRKRTPRSLPSGVSISPPSSPVARRSSPFSLLAHWTFFRRTKLHTHLFFLHLLTRIPRRPPHAWVSRGGVSSR